MNGASPMSSPMTSPLTHSATSLPELEFGHSRSEIPAGLMTAPSGRVRAPANLSASSAEAAGLLTSGTYGRISTTSSSSADLQSYLESRLRAKTGSIGSTLYSLTWKVRATPQQRSILALRASVPRTSVNGCSGWVTPSTRDWKDTIGMALLRPDGRSRVDQLPRQAGLVVPGQKLIGSSFLTERKGQMNPELARWLMSIPTVWASCAPTEMRLSLR